MLAPSNLLLVWVANTHRAKKAAVAAAVRSLIATHGFRLSMDAVAAKAGCSKQTLYSTYGDKQALLRSVIIDRLDTAAAALDSNDGDLRSMLLAFATDHLEHLAVGSDRRPGGGGHR